MGLPFFRQFSPGIQFLIFMTIHFMGVGLGNAVSGCLGIAFWKMNVFTHPEWLENISDPSVITFYRMHMAFVAIFGFLLPVYLFRQFMELPDQDYLFVRKKTHVKVMVTMLSVFILAFVAINLLDKLNSEIVLPGEYGKEIADYEKKNGMFVQRILFDSTYSGMIVNLMVVAVLPAIGEELIYRSIMVRLFSRIFKNVHWAVWIGALFFSLAHFSFSGFIPRFFMGALLGYVFVITGNIWYTIIIHFLNNAATVLLYFVMAREYDATYIDSFGRNGMEQVFGWMALLILIAWGISAWRKSKPYQMESELIYR